MRYASRWVLIRGSNKVKHGAYYLVRTQFYMLSGPNYPLFSCNTQLKCLGGLTPPNPPKCVRTKWKAPMYMYIYAVTYARQKHNYFRSPRKEFTPSAYIGTQKEKEVHM